MRLIGFPSIVVVDVLLAFGIPCVFDGQLVEQSHNRALDTVRHGFLHIEIHLPDVEHGELVLRQLFHFGTVTLPEFAGQLPDELFIFQQRPPVFQPDKPHILGVIETAVTVAVVYHKVENGVVSQSIGFRNVLAHIRNQRVVFLNQSYSSLHFHLIHLHGLRQVIRCDQFFQFRVQVKPSVSGLFHLRVNRAVVFRRRHINADNRHFHVCLAFRVPERAVNVLDFRVQFVQLPGENLPGICVGIADCLGIEQTDDFPSVAHNLNGAEQVQVAVGERRVHQAQTVTLMSAEREEIVVDNADIHTLENIQFSFKLRKPRLLFRVQRSAHNAV